MSRGDASGGTWYAFVGAKTVALGCRRGSEWIEDVGLEVSFEGASTDAVASALEELAGAFRQRGDPTGSLAQPVGSLTVVIADLWLIEATLPWNQAMRSREAISTFARNELAFCGHAVEDADRVMVDDAAYGRPRLVVAYPARLLAAIDALAGVLQVPVDSILPASVVAWHQAAPAPSAGATRAVGVADSSMQLIVVGVGTRPEMVLARRPQRCPEAGATAMDGLAALWARLRMRDPGFASAGPLHVLALEPPTESGSGSADPDRMVVMDDTPMVGSGASRQLHFAALAPGAGLALDGVGARRPASRLHRAIAMVSWIGIGVAGWVAWQASVDANVGPPRIVAPTVVESGWRRDELPRVRSVNAAVGTLNLPVLPLLAALVPPKDLAVFILGVDLSAAGSIAGGAEGVKIVAEATSVEDMARYVTFVSDQRPFIAAQLLRHEVVEAGPAGSIRFTVEAQWPR